MLIVPTRSNGKPPWTLRVRSAGSLQRRIPGIHLLPPFAAAVGILFLDGGNNKVLAQVVRKGTGRPLENESQVMKASDVKNVVDGWASDMHQSYLKLKAK